MGQEGIILITDGCSFVSQLEKNVYVSRVLLLTNNPLCLHDCVSFTLAIISFAFYNIPMR